MKKSLRMRFERLFGVILGLGRQLASVRCAPKLPGASVIASMSLQCRLNVAKLAVKENCDGLEAGKVSAKTAKVVLLSRQNAWFQILYF